MGLVEEKIFQALDKTFIQKLFERKKKLFFPSIKEEISAIEIERTSPVWAKGTCLVRYKILFDNKNQKIVRGTARTHKSKKATFDLMKYLYRNSFSKGDLRIAKPLDFIPSYNLLLYGEAPGVTLIEVIEKENGKKVETILKNTARWLVKLHNLSFDNRKFPKAIFNGFLGYKNIFQKIERYMPELKKDLPPLNKLKFVNQIWRDRKTLIHNDFYPGNSVSDGKNIFGIDFDRAGSGPFLMDLATFYGALEFPKEIWELKISKNQINDFQNIFLKEYCRLRRLDYLKIKKDLRKFLIKIFLDQIYYYTVFTIKGWKFMDKNTKSNFILKIKSLLLKTKQYLKNI